MDAHQVSVRRLNTHQRASLAPVIVPALLILLGVGLRTAHLTTFRFHVDEALYATHAREVAAGGDVLLRAFDVDKPPLSIYVVAASFGLLGASEFAARLPNLLASAASLAVLWALARRLYRRSAGMQMVGASGTRSSNAAQPHLQIASIALLLVVLSPYDILFAPTVFAEPQLTLWVLLACWSVVGDRWGWAGVCLALALATKQSAVLYLPLVVALGVVAAAGQVDARSLARRLGRLALPALVGLALLALWDAPRGLERSFWVLGYAHNTPDRWVRADEVMPRLEAWLSWLRYFTGADALSAALVAGGAGALAWAVRARPRQRETVFDLALAGFALAYLGMLWLRAFNTYDRYLHTLLPLLALPAARGVVWLSRGRSWRTLLAALAIAALMAGPALAALRGDIPVGGDKGRHDGVEAVAAFLNSLPPGTTVCDHWMGWELGFYLGRTPPVRVIWLPRPDALAASAPCYLPASVSEPLERWLAAAGQAGLPVELAFTAPNRWGAPSYVVYRIG